VVGVLRRLWNDARFRLSAGVAGLGSALLWSQSGPPLVQNGRLDWQTFTEYAMGGWILPAVVWGLGLSAILHSNSARESDPKDSRIVTHPKTTAVMATAVVAYGVETVVSATQGLSPSQESFYRLVMHTNFTSPVFPVVTYGLALLRQYKPPHILNAIKGLSAATERHQQHDVIAQKLASKHHSSWHGALHAAEEGDLERALVLHDGLDKRSPMLHSLQHVMCYPHERARAEKNYERVPENPVPLILLQTGALMYGDMDELWRLHEIIMANHKEDSIRACQAEILAQAGIDNRQLIEPLLRDLAARSPDHTLPGATSKIVYELAGEEYLRSTYVAYRAEDLSQEWHNTKNCAQALGVNAVRPWGFVPGEGEKGWDTMFVRRIHGPNVSPEHVEQLLSVLEGLATVPHERFPHLDYLSEFKKQLGRIGVEYRSTHAWGALRSVRQVIHNNIHPFHNISHAILINRYR
ncbi:MAG: hypothetical protein QGI09_07975, partial [Dehalococcoidia bacterium]|nr:hypothetical protein [Dehalococcoidia bacterium]